MQKILNEKNVTQAELARRTGINLVQINRYATGRQTPSPRNAVIIAHELGVTLSELFPEYV